MPSIHLNAALELQAAATGCKPRRLRILAYAGGVMEIPGFGPTLIDLAGMELPASIPILADHSNELASMVGSGRPTTDGKTLTITGTAADTMAAREVLGLIEAGHTVQASIGCSAIEATFITGGKSVTANGRVHAADDRGFSHVTRSKLVEVSATPAGCDSSTSINIAAKAASGGSQMTFEKWCQTIGVDPAAATPELREVFAKLYPTPDATAHAAWSGAGILATDAPHLIAQASREQWTPDRCRSEALAVMRAKLPTGIGPANPHRGSSATDARHLAAALMVRSGFHAAAEVAYGPAVMEQSRRLHAASLPDLIAAALTIDGREVPRDRGAMIKAGLSTGSMPVALGDSANKVLEATYRLAPATWRSWCAIRPAANFKVQSSIRPSFLQDLEEVGDGGSVKHGNYSESVFTWQIGQFAKKFSIGRKSFFSDDLSVFSEVVPALGKAALRSLPH